METLLSFLVSFLVAALRDWLQDRKRLSDARAEGAAEAAERTETVIKEKEDAQKQNDAAERGGAAGVAERLRKSLGN